ncbi:MAG: ATP-grasp domain-containing protein [Bacteroidales bacterium]|nr:ATP-grasp domain-containing protein [Bacteroidales bacterium]
MKQINVLILGVGGNVSQGIVTAIKNSNLNCRIVGVCIGDESLGLYFCDTAYISPYANDPHFIDWVADVCNKEQIDIMFSGVEENVMALESNRASLESKTKAIFISSSKDQLETGLSKYKTAVWLKENGCNYPKSADICNKAELDSLIQEVGFPLIAKPNSGKGSQGIFIVHSYEELLPLEGKDYCIQELLGDEKSEYTIACYVDKYGKSQPTLIMHRHLKHGTTFMAEIVQNDLIKAECEKICEKFQPKGPLNIQLRMHNGKPVCFELNVRFSGTTPIRARWGYNDVEAMIREYVLNEPVILNPLKEGKVYRYYNEAFIDMGMQKELQARGYVSDCASYHNYINDK